MQQFICDNCGTATKLHQQGKPVFQDIAIVDFRGKLPTDIGWEPTYVKQPVLIETEIMNPVTFEIEKVQMTKTEPTDGSLKTHLVQLRVSEFNVQRDLCPSCYKDILEEPVKALFAKMKELKPK